MVVGLVFWFSLWCVDWVGCLLCISVGVASGPGVGLVGRGVVLDPPVVCSTD